ncbi:hypothetical protein SLA2020_374320 [Shorea laevis]
MDWYFGNGIDDLVVPKDHELSDRFPSPESWPNWGISAPGNIESPNKCFTMDTNLSQDFNEVEMESPLNAKDQSCCSSVCGGLSEESLLNHAPTSHQQLDYQLDEFSRFQQMDDIFLNSLLENLPENEDLDKPYLFSLDSDHDMMPSDNLLEDVVSNYQSIENSKHLNTHACSPSQSLQKEVPVLCISPTNMEKKNSLTVKVPIANIPDPSENSCINGHLAPEPSLEESVLRELETVMTQLPDKTRVCFRDAFYRLAKNSKQNFMAHNQSRNLPLETEFPSHDAKIRPERQNAVESETNTIDRAIASLTFNKMEVNVLNFPLVKQNGTKTTGALKHSSNLSEIHCFPLTSIVLSDAEVPTFVSR